ncbi:MAG: hypothetical protein MI922_11025, partial [Bacteroidales bacterium]|nr:hypothetical protein [Bacteroidales bacterium]
MTENKYILPESLDLEFLKQKGIEELEKLSTGTWTDFNTHDPGITILEHLSYAALDFNYRSSFPVEDILADNANKPPALHTARKVMHSSALSLDDYRRLMINCNGVINAHIVPIASPEPKIYLYKKRIQTDENNLAYNIDKLSSIAPIEHNSTSLEKAEALKLKGLYKVLLELEDDDIFGDLNSNRLSKKITSDDVDIVSNTKTDVLMEVEFPNWDLPIDWNNNQVIYDNIKCISWFVDANNNHCKLSSTSLKLKIEEFISLVENNEKATSNEAIKQIIGFSEDLLKVIENIPLVPLKLGNTYDEFNT